MPLELTQVVCKSSWRWWSWRRRNLLCCTFDPAYKGAYILEANSTRRPVAVNRNKAAVTEEDGIIYSGCYVNASLAAAGYTFGKVKKGVKAYLNGVQFVKDGDRFGSDALSDFDALDGEDDDFFN